VAWIGVSPEDSLGMDDLPPPSPANLTVRIDHSHYRYNLNPAKEIAGILRNIAARIEQKGLEDYRIRKTVAFQFVLQDEHGDGVEREHICAHIRHHR
jgi:hypothetical protein